MLLPSATLGQVDTAQDTKSACSSFSKMLGSQAKLGERHASPSNAKGEQNLQDRSKHVHQEFGRQASWEARLSGGWQEQAAAGAAGLGWLTWSEMRSR